jgi:hypothetical protein
MFQKLINKGTILGNVNQRISLLTLRIYDPESYFHKTQIESVFSNLDTQIRSSSIVNKHDMLIALSDVKNHFDNIMNTTVLKQLMKQVTSDKKTVSRQSVYSALVQFFIIGKLIDNSISLPESNTIATVISGKNFWLYHMSDSSPMPEEMMIASFLNYFINNKNHCTLHDGTVFLSSVSHSGICDGSSCCMPISRTRYQNIALDFMNQGQTYSNFMDIQDEKNIELQCGNNVTNIFKLNEATLIL